MPTARSIVLCLALAPLACMPSGATLAPIETTPVEVPVVVQRGLVLVPVRIDGIDRELTMMLDTGAPTVLRAEIAQELGLVMSDSSGLRDAAGQILESTRIDIEGVHIGGLHMRRITGFAATLPSFAEHCLHIDGVLGVGADRGSGFLDRTAIEIDYAASKIVLAPSADALTPGGTEVPVRRHEIMPDGSTMVTPPVIEVGLGGAKQWVLLDTGNNGSIDLSAGMFAALGRSFDEPGLVRRTGALSQTATGVQSGVSYETRIDLKLGELDLIGVPVTVEQGEGRVEPPGAQRVLLGYHLLRNFRVVLDIPGGKARFVPVPGADTSAGARGLGFSWRDMDGKVTVATLVVGGPAERSGIAVGDELVSIDGVAMRSGETETLCAVRKAIDDAEAQPVRVAVRREGGVYEASLVSEPVLLAVTP